MIAIIDYGVGNLFSLKASIDHLKIPCEITNDREKIASASHIILPGVGAFGDAYKNLVETGLVDFIKEQAKVKPLMGICLGMQLLFEKSYEFGECEGLGLIKGEIIDMRPVIDTSLKVPHMGWNKLEITNTSRILKYTKNGDSVYFVHSFYAKTEPEFVTSVAEYSIPITATVQNGNVFGCQFHPEKSGEIGLKILKAFYEV